jgi:hypothetical protein
MTNLSPAAHAILTAVTQRQYSCDPIDVPEATGRIKYEAAAVLRAVADQVVPKKPTLSYPEDYELGVWVASDDARVGLLAIADELEALPE